jgi:hypothetical protein
VSYLLQAFEALQRLVVVAPARIIAVTDNTDARAGSDARENGLGRLEGASGDERRQIADDYLAGSSMMSLRSCKPGCGGGCRTCQGTLIVNR